MSGIFSGEFSSTSQGLVPASGGGAINYLRADGAWSAPSGGGGGFSLISNTALNNTLINLDINNLGSYTSLLIFARLITLANSGTLQLRFSIDNGASFFSGASDYIGLASTGIETGTSAINITSVAATAARSGWINILGSNINGISKVIQISRQDGPSAIFAASQSPINAIRLTGSAGGNLVSGNLIILGQQ